jgi:hypothetical protein
MPKVKITPVGSLVEGTRTDMYSKPTLDVVITPAEIQMDAFSLRNKVVNVLQLTTSQIKIRNSEALLSDLYPCIICEDILTIKDYKVRLIFGLKSNYISDFTNFKD